MGGSNNRGKTPKMDGESNGKPLENGRFGGKTHYFWKTANINSFPKQRTHKATTKVEVFKKRSVY